MMPGSHMRAIRQKMNSLVFFLLRGFTAKTPFVMKHLDQAFVLELKPLRVSDVCSFLTVNDVTIGEFFGAVFSDYLSATSFNSLSTIFFCMDYDI